MAEPFYVQFTAAYRCPSRALPIIQTRSPARMERCLGNQLDDRRSDANDSYGGEERQSDGSHPEVIYFSLHLRDVRQRPGETGADEIKIGFSGVFRHQRSPCK